MAQFFMLGGLNNNSVVVKNDAVKQTEPAKLTKPAKPVKPAKVQKPASQPKNAPVVKKESKPDQTNKKPAAEARPALKTLITEYLKSADGPISIKEMRSTLFTKWGEWSDASFKSATKDVSLFKKSNGMIELNTSGGIIQETDDGSKDVSNDVESDSSN